jgi:hypothetical protein
MLKYSELYEYDVQAANSKVVQSRSRNISPPQLVKDRLVYSVEGHPKTDPAAPKSGDGSVYAVLEDLVPVIYINGIKKILKPNGGGNYIWLSLSPDRTRLLYNFQGRSTFICDLEGKIIVEAGKINAPKWLNNQLIIGMNDRDDGYRVLSSDIICYSLSSGKITNLTNSPGVTEMYPLPFPGGKRAVYHTIDGYLYIIDLEVK